MNDDTIVTITIGGGGIVCITVLEMMAMHCGINGVGLAAAVAAIGAIVAGILGFKLGLEKKT